MEAMPGNSPRNLGRKRQRDIASVGDHSPSPEPPLLDFFIQFNEDLSGYIMANSPSAQDSVCVACPFLKHDPERYAYVQNSCTETGFKDAGSLRDHIKRVHSRTFGCTICLTHRFNCAKTSLDAARVKHQSQKICRDATKNRAEKGPNATEPVEWMTEEQEMEYGKLDLRKTKQNTLEESFREIYTHLWPECNNNESSIPSYRHEPGFLVSRVVINKILENYVIGSYRRLPSAQPPSQQLPSYEQAGQAAAPAEAEVEQESITQQQPEEPADMLGSSVFLYPSPFGDSVPNPALIDATSNNRNYLEALPYDNISNNNNITSETRFVTPGNFAPQPPTAQSNDIAGNRGCPRYIMSERLYCNPMSLDEGIVEPFQYMVQGPTNQSLPDSAYGTKTSGENDGGNTQPHLPQQNPHHQPRSTAQQNIEYFALQHAGPTDLEQIPSGDDELDISELPDDENGEYGTDFTSYLAQRDGWERG